MIPLQPPAKSQTATTLTGIERVLSDVQEALSALPFLSGNSLGRVLPQYVSGKTEPWIRRYDLTPSGEYYRAYPNDTLPAFSCLYAHEDEEYDETTIKVTRTVSVIVWLNLEQVAVDLETAKFQVLQMLRNLYNVSSVNKCVDQTADGSNSVYPGFDVDDLEEQYLTYPFAAFRIESSIAYQNLCY